MSRHPGSGAEVDLSAANKDGEQKQAGSDEKSSTAWQDYVARNRNAPSKHAGKKH